jgi:hypothetical protein
VLSRAAVVVAAFALLAPAVGPVVGEDAPKKGRKPALEIRPSPRFAF